MAKDDHLDILRFPSLFVVVVICLLFWYCFHSGLLRRCCQWLSRRRGGRFDPREPLLGEAFIWTTERRDLLIKRCDQSSTNEIENHIIARLKQDIRSRTSVELVESSWDRALDDGRKPVIVFCVISSRIGTDIENAMKGVNVNTRVLLVILHSVLRGLLRGDLSDDEELLDTTLTNRMTGIAHFAFSDREGLYECRQNTVGFNKLLDVVSALPQ